MPNYPEEGVIYESLEEARREILARTPACSRCGSAMTVLVERVGFDPATGDPVELYLSRFTRATGLGAAVRSLLNPTLKSDHDWSTFGYVRRP